MGVKGATWILCHNKKHPEKLYCFKNRKSHNGDKRWNITEPTVIISKEGDNNFHIYYVNEQRIIIENTDNVLQVVSNLKLNDNYSKNFINDYKEHRTLYGIKKTRPIFEILTEENDESTLSEIETVNNHYSSSHNLRTISIVNNIEPVGKNERETFESCSYNYHLIVRKYEALEEKLKDFCTENSHLQDNINNRFDEWRCGFLQIMEEFIHEVLHVCH
ncbi:jg22274 [Pararge aegeria aegeria]|uniref:Jg22274 protein n=1 Tax=Pararge aegeria aegeria TaxID=348720 RepID=A0A8S4QXN0_9NEOP|nr:jg22274 [Pararge aegeria aegeria]